MGAAIGTAALGCGSGAADSVVSGGAQAGVGGAGGGYDNGAGGNGGGGGNGGAGGAQPVDHCKDTGGLSAEDLLAPIETIVVLCMENRSFDHYLGALRLLEKKEIIGLTGMESNPAPDGTSVPIFNLTDFTPSDPPHGWDACHAQWNQGANDGFVKEHAGDSQNDVMGYHVREQIPITYALADASAICHRYFASVMGPTWPNRFYLHGGTSKGQKGNLPVFGYKSIWNLLSDAGISAKNYYHDIAWASGAFFKTGGLAGIDSFFQDAAAGALPQFSIIDPQFFGAGANDDHPDHDVQLGQALIATVFSALANSPQWSKCLFVLTYDEHGGFYDHVPPPTTEDDEAGFEQLGFRVPTLVAGPFVQSGCAVDTLLEHTSIVKTATTRFGLPTLNKRVAAANDLSGAISPHFFDKPQPAPELPKLDVSMSAIRALSARPRSEHHPEIWQAAERGIIPRRLDRRSAGLGASEHVLAWGERLGALRIRK
jgi:phospholipase C